VEHPALIAERIRPLRRLVGRENVIAGTDCGRHLGGPAAVDPDIVWAKLAIWPRRSLASRELW